MAERGHTEKIFRVEVGNIVVRWPSGDTLKNISWKSEGLFSSQNMFCLYGVL